QQAAYDALGKLNGAVVAIDPKTGRILALVSKPSFNANLLASHVSSKAQSWYKRLLGAEGNPLLNKATSELYAPGSVFKLVVASAAIQSGNYTAESLIPNPKRFKLPGTSTYVYNSGEGKCGGKEKVSIADALRFSCNVPFAQLGIELGQDRISQQAALFGFGQSIEIPLEVEASVYPKNMDDAQTGLSAFGQFDDRVSVVQMAMVSSAIANQGVLMQPNLIENVQSSTLSILSQPKPRVMAQPISSATANIMKEMMVNAVSTGVSGNAKIEGVRVAGKTGTAQNGEGEPYTLWFTGFAPADDPQVAVAVVIADGGGMGQRGFGNLLAAPVAKKVMEAVLGK
ncbi:MAG: peptidoglycan D,D-transpeptidase FtsI family protein, partial [Micrococcales bacterium]